MYFTILPPGGGPTPRLVFMLLWWFPLIKFFNSIQFNFQCTYLKRYFLNYTVHRFTIIIKKGLLVLIHFFIVIFDTLDTCFYYYNIFDIFLIVVVFCCF